MGIEGSEIRKLYIRLPIKITDEVVIRDLHPNIIKVHLPRQKTRRWCVVDFENNKKFKEAIEDLKKIKLNNKNLKLKPYKKGPTKKKEKDTRAPFLGNPYEREDEWGDSDLDLNRDEEWVTFQNDFLIPEERDPQNLLVDMPESDGDLSPYESEDLDDDEDYEDEDYDPDNEDYEQTQEFEDLEVEMNDSEGSSSPSFYGLYNDDDDNGGEFYEEVDYVIYPFNDNETTSDNNSKTTTESNSNNLTTTDTDTD